MAAPDNAREILDEAVISERELLDEAVNRLDEVAHRWHALGDLRRCPAARLRAAAKR